MARIINQLRQARKARKLSQYQMSQVLDLPQGHISKIENGKTDLRLSNLEEMTRILGLELMLVPKELVPFVHATIEGKDIKTTPRWLPDEDDDEQA